MCGIAGEVRFDGRPASAERVARMTRALKPRGPDGEGIVARDRVALGHRRLKIIDLSDRARQPMEDPELGLTLVFNGCIYNHKALRRELECKAYRFFSDSDSEVVLKAYHAWGPDCVDRFNGMFAFVIYERDSGRVCMARDRLGIKPLYYTKTPGVLRFASTLPALLKVNGTKPDIDPVALHHYMSFHSVVPASRTIFAKIMKLPPAKVRTFEAHAGTFVDRDYWQPEFDRACADAYLRAEEELVQGLLDQLRLAVSRRMEADVPVGVLLSGGVDSSLITGLLAEMGEVDLKTFSIGFNDTEGERGSEFEFSDIVAKEFRTDHHRIFVDSDQVMESLPECIEAMSEPMVSHDNIGFYLLAKYVSQHLTVVQSGQGADEIFGGYHWYRELETSDSPVDDYARAFFDRTPEQLAEVLDENYLEQDYSREFVAEHFAAPGAIDPVDKALRIDTTVMMVDDPLKRVDNMTMAWGLEGRVPFLDHELVEFAARIPPQLKIKNGGKHVLKEAARRIIPDAVIDRPKGYFPVPELKHLRGRALEYVADALNSRTARERGLFKRPLVEHLLDEPSAHITPLNGSGLWQMGTLELWLQAHNC